MESIRVIMLRNWHFDIINREHWKIAWDLWTTTWVISEPKEWAFVFIVISFIPLWFTGWIALSMVSWGKFIWFILTLPWKIIKNIFYHPVKIITNSTTTVPITKHASYKEIRPRALKGTTPFMEQPPVSAPILNSPMPTPTPSPAPSPVINTPTAPQSQNSAFDHALFKFDDSSDDIDFDIDSFDVRPSAPKNKAPENRSSKPFEEEIYDEEYSQRKPARSQRYLREDPEYRRPDKKSREESENKPLRNNTDKKNYDKNPQRSAPQKSTHSCADVIKQKGYEILNRLTVKNITVDYVALSANSIYLCLLDREEGDWLADEERFNDEEPLWFSENSHRISPVRKLEIVKQAISSKLEDAELNFGVEAILIEQIGNIINAEDMFEIWDSMNIKVCRMDRGMPKELQPFARVLPDADKHISSSKLEKLTKLLRNIG